MSKNMKNAPAADQEHDVATQDNIIAGKDIGVAPGGVKFNPENPGENIPCFVPGKNWKEGQTIAGRYIGTTRVESNKFAGGKGFHWIICTFPKNILHFFRSFSP